MDNNNTQQIGLSVRVTLIARFLILVLSLVLYIVVIYLWVDLSMDEGEHKNFIRCFYFGIATITTVGYGDIHPEHYNLWSALLVLWGILIGNQLTGFISYLLSYLPINAEEEHPAEEGLWNWIKRKLTLFRLVVVATIVLFIIGCILIWLVEEEKNWENIVYLTMVSITTVGYGDLFFHRDPGRFTISCWLMIATSIANQLIEISFKLIWDRIRVSKKIKLLLNY